MLNSLSWSRPPSVTITTPFRRSKRSSTRIRGFGNTTAKWLDLLAGDDACVRESLFRRVDELRQEIVEAGTDTPLERLLTERIVASWLMTRFFDLALGQAAEGSRASHVRYLQQQLDRSQRRYVAAVKGLAELRKLLP